MSSYATFFAATKALYTNGIVAGAADIGFANLASIAFAYSKGIPITVVAPGSVYDRKAVTSALLVAKTSPIQSARDLNGKIVAAAGLGTITEFATRAWVDKNGGDAKTIRFIEMSQPSSGKPTLPLRRVFLSDVANAYSRRVLNRCPNH